MDTFVAFNLYCSFIGLTRGKPVPLIVTIAHFAVNLIKTL